MKRLYFMNITEHEREKFKIIPAFCKNLSTVYAIFEIKKLSLRLLKTPKYIQHNIFRYEVLRKH